MNTSHEYLDLFDTEGHFNEEGQALAVDALILGKVPLLPAPVMEHLTVCSECRKAIASLYDLVAENRELHPRVYHPLFDREAEGQAAKSGLSTFASGFMRRLRSPFGIAASLLILFAMGTAVFWMVSSGNDEEDIRREIVGIMEPDSIATPGGDATAETLQYALNQGDRRISDYNGNPKLEALMALHLRGNDFRMKSPGKSTTVKELGKMVFEWESGGQQKKLDLLIIDEEGVNRDQIALKQKRYQFTVNLPSGLYYWVIVGDGALMSAGKFSVIGD